MPPFDRTRLGGTLALTVTDVFVEEEEDAFWAENGTGKPADGAASTRTEQSKQVSDIDDKSCDDSEMGLGIQIVDSGSRPSTIHEDLPITPNDNNNKPRQPSSQDAVHIVDADQLTLRLDKPSEPSTPSTRSPFLEAKRPSTSPDFGMPKFGLPSDLPPPMAGFPSPDPDSSSLEVPRLMTASSSMTDRHTFSSCYSGEPSSDYILDSTEDIPSSAASTATGNARRKSSHFYSRALTDPSDAVLRPPRSRGSDRSKRSSLVSLTKFMGGSTGERSKLSQEQRADNDDEPEKTKKKAHRFSRLMSFWKDREKEPKDAE
jgi:hypothetical protein